MRVFVTGASGHIGSAVVPELLAAGHAVVGLARSDQSAAALAAMGAEVHRGDLDDLEGLRAAAVAADGVIHLAFKHEAMVSGDYGSAIAADLRAVQTFGNALAGTGKPFVGTSGTLMLAMAGLGRIGTESDVTEAGGGRTDAENAVIGFAERGIRSSVVRLPPTVHSSLDHHGFVPSLIAIGRGKGSPAMSAKDRTGGRPGTLWTPATCIGWPWNLRPPVRGCTLSATRECHSGTSPRSLAGT